MSVVTLANAKSHLEIAHSAQDTILQVILDGVEDWLAKNLNIKLTSTAGIVEDLDGGDFYLWPGTRPVTVVTSVVDRWGNNAAQTVALIGDGRIARVDSVARPIGKWPEGLRRWRATYTAGYAALPADLQLAILQLAARAYRQRSGESSQSASGASFNWPALMDSDIAKLMQAYSRRTVVRVG